MIPPVDLFRLRFLPFRDVRVPRVLLRAWFRAPWASRPLSFGWPVDAVWATLHPTFHSTYQETIFTLHRGLSLYNLKVCLLMSGVERRRHPSHCPACQADVRSAPAPLSPQIFGDAAVATGLTGYTGGQFATQFDKNIQIFSERLRVKVREQGSRSLSERANRS